MHKIPIIASQISMNLLLYLSCIQPLKTVIPTTGIFPMELKIEYLVTAFFLPIAYNINAVNAAFANP